MNSTDSIRLRRLLDAAGLFDETFYAAAYGPSAAGREGLISRFIDVGVTQGHLPNPRFDPLVYGYLVPESWPIGPLVHHLESRSAFEPPPLDSLFPRCKPRQIHAAAPVPTDPTYVQACRAAAGSAAAPREIPFTAGGRVRCLEVPDGGLFVERLHRDEPFAFARLPHGLWDSLLHRELACEALRAERGLDRLSDIQRRSLATRVTGAFLPGNCVFHGAFVEELEDLVRDGLALPDFHTAIAFRGYPGPDEALFAGPGPDDQRLLLAQFARLFPELDRVVDATLWKRMAIAGTLAPLADACRQHHVILVASDLFADLDSRWQLPRFSHVAIPRSRGHEARWQLAGRLVEALTQASREAGAPPIVITQCGGSLAYWLIARLARDRPDAFYLDLGQALNAWFLDVAEIPVLPWMQVYRPSIVGTPGFGGFYRARLGRSFESWFAGLSARPDPPAARSG